MPEYVPLAMLGTCLFILYGKYDQAVVVKGNIHEGHVIYKGTGAAHDGSHASQTLDIHDVINDELVN